jgi:hypothetical protein
VRDGFVGSEIDSAGGDAGSAGEVSAHTGQFSGKSVWVETQSGGVNVTGDRNHVVVSFGAAQAEAAAPADVAAAERMLFVRRRAGASTVSVASWLSPHAGLAPVQPRRGWRRGRAGRGRP